MINTSSNNSGGIMVTGGLTEHFVYNVRTLERMGVSAVIIEDKTGLKKNSLFGTEVEQTQASIEEFSAKIAAEFFGTRRYQNTASRNGYSTWSAWDADGREWKFQKDVSIHGPDSEKCELVSPILHYSDIELVASDYKDPPAVNNSIDDLLSV